MIVIAAAGASSRFKKEGILTPKFMLPLADKSVFDFVLESFKPYFQSQEFLIVTRDNNDAVAFLQERCRQNGIKNYEIISDENPQGMFPSVYQGLKRTRFSLDQEIMIHVADVFRRNLQMPLGNSRSLTIDFERPASGDENIESLFQILKNKCKGLGCYHFSSAEDFTAIYEKARAPKIREYFGEKAMEISEGVGMLIRAKISGVDVKYRLIAPTDVVYCGTPLEYRNLPENFAL